MMKWMWNRNSLLTLIAAGIICCGTAPSVSAQEGASDELQAKMMEKWTAFMTPGKPHNMLAKRAGKWEYKLQAWMAPGAPPETSEGTTDSKMMMEGRYLIDHVKGSFMGQPFEGAGVTGYDNMKKKFVQFWIDNMGTGFVTAEGTYDEKTKSITYKMLAPDVINDKYVQSRSIERHIDKDTYEVEMYSTGPDGKEFKSMQMRYTRVK